MSDSVVFSCVGENQPGKWFDRMYNFVLSIRTFGGALADAPIVVNIVGGVDPEFRALLDGLRAEIRIVERVDPRHPWLNKLRMFELADEREFDVLLAMDCDIVVLGDVSPNLIGNKLGGVIAGNDWMSEKQWRHLYAEFGIERPEKKWVTPRTGVRTYPYFNTGVVHAPPAICRDLVDRWHRYALGILDRREAQPKLLEVWQHVDQYAFALSVADLGVPFDALPLGMNWAITFHRQGLPRMYRDQARPPFVVHYHAKVDDRGFLWRPALADLEPLVEEFNRRRAEALGLSYSGLAEQRFARNAKDASPRSRLERRARAVKRAILKPLSSARN